MKSAASQSSPNPRIAVEINTATKKLHVELNRLIIERLPLALPPHTQTPARYAIGLARFVAIFFAFERVLQEVEAQSTEKEDKHTQEIARWIASLVPRQLYRSDRLRADMEHLCTIAKVDLSTVDADTKGMVAALAAREPHVLVAYTWTMYMAIFSGGRWIRQQLASAGNDFWSDTRPDTQTDMLGFSFLSFDENDGEDLKTEFKKRLSDADELLTDQERQEIVDAGQELFQQCIDLINKIDRDVWWYESTSSWSPAYLVVGLGLFWVIWRLFTGQSVLTA